MAKLSSGKTFAVGMQMTFCGCLMTSLAPRVKPIELTYSTKIRGEIFTIECKIVKTAKVFPLESFAVYGIQWLIDDHH